MSEGNYLLLYELAKDNEPYRPTATWCTSVQYQTTDLLHPKIKSKFIPDEILVIKREFIKDNF
jgi:hypothetical protein